MTYVIAGREFLAVDQPGGLVHLVATDQRWKGLRSWQHAALCRASVTGHAVRGVALTCPGCHRAVRALITTTTQED